MKTPILRIFKSRKTSFLPVLSVTLLSAISQAASAEDPLSSFIKGIGNAISSLGTSGIKSEPPNSQKQYVRFKVDSSRASSTDLAQHRGWLDGKNKGFSPRDRRDKNRTFTEDGIVEFELNHWKKAKQLEWKREQRSPNKNDPLSEMVIFPKSDLIENLPKPSRNRSYKNVHSFEESSRFRFSHIVDSLSAYKQRARIAAGRGDTEALQRATEDATSILDEYLSHGGLAVIDAESYNVSSGAIFLRDHLINVCDIAWSFESDDSEFVAFQQRHIRRFKNSCKRDVYPPAYENHADKVLAQVTAKQDSLLLARAQRN